MFFLFLFSTILCLLFLIKIVHSTVKERTQSSPPCVQFDTLNSWALILVHLSTESKSSADLRNITPFMDWVLLIFTFFHILDMKKVSESWKFLTSSIWWIYTFWDVLNTISLFLQNVCLSTCGTNFVAELAIRFWWYSWLDFDAYRSKIPLFEIFEISLLKSPGNKFSQHF